MQTLLNLIPLSALAAAAVALLAAKRLRDTLKAMRAASRQRRQKLANAQPLPTII